jgi:hypothetical protein
MPERDLATAVSGLGAATREFAGAVQGLRRRQAWVIGLVVLTLCGTVVGGAVAFRLYDCTTPGVRVVATGWHVAGGCYRDGQRRMADAVRSLTGDNDRVVAEIRDTCGGG